MGFEIETNGAWINATLEGHCFDYSLANGLSELLTSRNVRRIVDLGCGPGWYVKILKDSHFYVEGYDGNPYTPAISEIVLDDGTCCEQLDLTIPIIFGEPFECVLSLEVGEHIPAEYEHLFLDNITNNSSRYIILSWAVEGQGGSGHVNCRNNDYVIQKMLDRGFVEEVDAKEALRSVAHLDWFKNTIMVFRRMD